MKFNNKPSKKRNNIRSKLRDIFLFTTITVLVITYFWHRFDFVFYDVFNFKILSNFDEGSSKPFMTPDKLGNYETEPKLYGDFGPGENGEPVDLRFLNNDEIDISLRLYGYNLVASDMISLNRRIKDFRPKECMHWNYPINLPKASVIIVFYNEGYSTLLRTIHSVINTTPRQFLEEIILIDDYSKNSEGFEECFFKFILFIIENLCKVDLKDRLEFYIKRFNGLVKIFRNKKNEGLIKARIMGVEKAIGEVIVILDAHIECSTNWLPPLLTRIVLNRKVLAVPIIDNVNWNTFEHFDVNHRENRAGIFEWGFLYKEMPASSYPNYTRVYDSEPYWSPTHAGGLFAIDRNWFLQLGTYDIGIEFWGGEQYELSFKIWQCGGAIEWVPCSHIAHVYRGLKVETEQEAENTMRQISKNHLRVIETWMDEYKEHFYTREPQTRKLDYGNISNQLKLRKKLNCKSFKWYMETIAFDLKKKFPIPPKNLVWGHCYNKNHNVCFDLHYLNKGPDLILGASKCATTVHGNQLFRLNVEGELSNYEYCFESNSNEFIYRRKCLIGEVIWNPVGEWSYDKATGLLWSNKKRKCLITNGNEIFLTDCDHNNLSQIWEWQEQYF